MAPPDAGPVPVIVTEKLTKTYPVAGGGFTALADVDLTIASGEFVAVTGASGSGKSTLMNLLGCLDRPTAGEYRLLGTPVATMDDDRLAAMRNRQIGFVFQGFNLLPRLTLSENVALPLVYAGVAAPERARRARAELARVGLAPWADAYPNRISGGQQQRTAIARALVNRPQLLLADEPTGNLDSHTSGEIMDLLGELNGAGVTLIVVTHETDIAARARRRISFRDGRIVADSQSPPTATGRQPATA
jgi:putative ABC transport system ATP-binding protein